MRREGGLVAVKSRVTGGNSVKSSSGQGLEKPKVKLMWRLGRGRLVEAVSG